MEPLVSVILPVWNCEDTISRTLQSVENQTYRNIQLIIVDDASSDGTFEKISEIVKGMTIDIKILKNEVNVGVANSRNKAIQCADGDYLAFIDGDDMWLPEKITLQLRAMLKKNLDFSFTNYVTVNADYENQSTRYLRPRRYYLSDFFKGNPAGLLTVMIKSERNLADLFPDVHHEDYAGWIRLMRNGVKAELLDQVTAKYMVHQSASSNKFKSIIWTIQIMYKFGELRGLEIIKSVLHYGINVLRRNKNSAVSVPE